MRKTGFYSILTLSVILLVLSIIPFGSRQSAQVRQPPRSAPVRTKPANFNVLAQANSSPTTQNSLSADSSQSVQTEPRFDEPTFLWAPDSGAPQQLNMSPAQRRDNIVSIARAQLSRYADRYRLEKSDLVAARASAVHDTGNGAIIVKFKQDIGGIEVFGDEVNVVMNQNLQLVAITGYLTGAGMTDTSAVGNFALQPEQALSVALNDMTGQTVDPASFNRLAPATSTMGTLRGRQSAAAKPTNDPYLRFTAATSNLKGFSFSDEPSRTRPMIFHTPDRYIPAYYVETSILMPSSDQATISATGTPLSEEWAYLYVVSAEDGQILMRKNLVVDQSSTYRVWADPTTKAPYDSPAGNGVHPKLIAVPDGAQASFVAQQDVSLANYPFSHSATDPWLAAGATETNGNNVDAFLNLFSPDGFGTATTTTPTDIPTGDFRAQATGPNAFQHSFTAGTDTSKAEARQAAIQQMFYNLNFLHDWFYDAGFDEPSGNAQTDNYGRGGLAADNIKAQAQDFSGFNNANMATPADGSRPRMRMYIFPSIGNVLDVQATPAAAGKRNIGISMSGPQAFDITADIVKATFTSGPTTCTVTNAAALAGKIALFDFDNTDGTGCSFSTRIARLTTTTTASAILMDFQQTTPSSIASITGFVPANTTPVAVISWNGAATIKSELALSNTVTAHLLRQPDRDGTIDNQVMFHEWGHYISNRLVGNGAGLETNLSGGLGEGWGDFNAMLALTVRADDTLTPSDATWNGAYALATYATSGVDINGNGNNGYYYGIRRVPYSTDMSIDPLTYRHITNGQTISGAPINFGADGANNAEVHNTGEVWATMLWECYASLLRDTQGASPRLTFAQAQDRMKRYIVAAYKMTPSQPTLLEGRDAILAAALANDPTDFSLFAQAFAKRGAGAAAVSPDRFSTTNVGAVESFAVTGALAFVDASLDDSVVSHDSDGYLDDAETGLLTIRLKNTGVIPLTATSAQVSCDNPGVSFPSGNTANFASISPFGVGTATVQVHIEGQSGLQIPTFTITSNDTSLSTAAVVGTYKTYAYANEILNSSKTDTVEGRQTPWTISTNPGSFFNDTPDSRFRRQPAASGFQWFVPDYFAASNEFLTSPALTVDGSGSLNVQFDHTFGFEFSGTSNFDGGVVEMSVNGGPWTDIDQTIYPGTVITGSINPITGRKAFVKTGSGHVSATAAIAPGSQVQVRFQQGSDDNTGAAGWAIDNITFSGIVQTPFSTIVADNASALPFVSVTGRVTTSTGTGIPGATVTVTDGLGFRVVAVTNSFGFFRFDSIPNNHNYTFQATARRYTFAPQVVNVQNVVGNLTLTAN